jgi:hypothetical protein
MSRVPKQEKSETKSEGKDSSRDCCDRVIKRKSVLIGQLARSSTTSQPNPAALVPTVETAVFSVNESRRKTLGVLRYHTSDNSIGVRESAQLEVTPQFLVVKGGAIGTSVTSTFVTWLRIKRKPCSVYVDVPNSTWTQTYTRPTDSALLTPQYVVNLNPGERLQVMVGAQVPSLIGTVGLPAGTIGSIPIPAQPSGRLSVLAFSQS